MNNYTVYVNIHMEYPQVVPVFYGLQKDWTLLSRWVFKNGHHKCLLNGYQWFTVYTKY